METFTKKNNSDSTQSSSSSIDVGVEQKPNGERVKDHPKSIILHKIKKVYLWHEWMQSVVIEETYQIHATPKSQIKAGCKTNGSIFLMDLLFKCR